ncbi:hypothetical protein ARTSIC4J27_1263 [Pseudarthrobacter siccitolerans]|uniref:Uncharacterized protein n=1 Tax=Pseudarthrobacter siccitolerans TaxID=861266 RepID=A0A024GZW8_9MICC|nr:hypothetical protein ARTSIC4J27_1263 [Pseudarthrobacter siccitolerans]
MVVWTATPFWGLEPAIDPTKTFVVMPGAIRRDCGNNS